jgi:hypothetical protein
VPKATPPTFTWHLGAEARRAASPGTRHAALPPPEPEPGPGLLLLVPPAPRPATPLELALGAALSAVPIRSAHAHGDPFNGYGTLVAVSSTSNPKLARVFTGATSWTPSAAVWQTIVDDGGDLIVTLVGADFEQNRIPEGAGPYVGSVTALHIAP